MATFISLVSYTAQGIKAIKESPRRLDAARAAMAAMGVTLRDFYLTMGRYDLVIVVEAPDAATAAKALLAVASQGNVATETLTALTEEEFRRVVSELP